MHKIQVKTHFDAAHYLKGYQGACANLHGHNGFIFERTETLNSGRVMNWWRLTVKEIPKLL